MLTPMSALTPEKEDWAWRAAFCNEVLFNTTFTFAVRSKPFAISHSSTGRKGLTYVDSHDRAFS